MDKNSNCKTKPKRSEKEGNSLWRLYMELSVTKQRELRELFHCLGISWQNFLVSDSQANKAIWDIPLRRLKVYESFFGIDLTSHRLKLPAEFKGVGEKLAIDLDVERMMLAETA